MKHIKRDFKIQGPGWTKGVGSKSQIRLFQNNVMGHIKLKGITNGEAYVSKCFAP